MTFYPTHLVLPSFFLCTVKKNSSVAIITNDQFFREAATYFLSRQHYSVLDIGREACEVYEQLLHQRPDLVILHASHVSVQGASAIRCISENSLPTKTITYIDSDSKEFASHRAYLTRADGLDAMLRGVAMLNNSSATEQTYPVTSTPDPLALLTAQELRVLALIGKGLSSTELAVKLFVSKHTIKNHKTNITRKLDIASCRDLLTIALTLHNHPALVKSLNSVTDNI